MTQFQMDDVRMLDTLADELEGGAALNDLKLLYGTSVRIGHRSRRIVLAATRPSAGLQPLASLRGDIEGVIRVRHFGPRTWGWVWSTAREGPFFALLPWAEGYGARAEGLAATGVLVSKRVAVVGLGSVGSVAALLLAKANVGELVLVDGETVATENLLRTIYQAMHVGALKVRAAAELIALANPRVMVEAHEGELHEHLDALRNVDLIVNAASSAVGFALAARFHRHVPIVFPAVHARAASGEIFVSGGREHAERPCFACYRSRVSVPQGAGRTMNYGGSAHELQAEPGLGADIAHVVTAAVGVALHILTGKSEHVLDWDRQLLLTTHRHGALFERSFEARWVTVPRDESCPNHAEQPDLTVSEAGELLASIPEVSP